MLLIKRQKPFRQLADQIGLTCGALTVPDPRQTRFDKIPSITQREQLHDLRIGERVTAYSPYVQQFLSNQTPQNLQHSGDPAGALQQAYRMLQESVQLNAFVMAYSECFLALGVILLLGSATIWLYKKTKAVGAAAAH